MRYRPTVTFVILVAAGALVGAGRAQGLLDQQLGPSTAAATAPATVGPLPATPQPKPAGNNDIISPDAVKKVDDSDLINKLIQPDASPPGGAGPGQQAKDMISRMDQSKTRLTQRDPGPVTQETQRRILTDLEVLIEYARKMEQSTGSSQQPQPGQQPGQQRQETNGQQPGNNTGGGNVAAAQSFLPGGSPGAASSNGNDLQNRSNDKWGDLPPRDRDLVSHGANEEYLSAYRDMIDAYYKALAEMGRNRNK